MVNIFIAIFTLFFSVCVHVAGSTKDNKNRFVGICVGNVKLDIAATTLTKHKGSMLERMINGGIGVETTEDNYIRLDMSPKLFEYVVHWLRYDQVEFKNVVDAINTYHAADYLLLGSLKDLIYQWIKLNYSTSRGLRWLKKHSRPDSPEEQLAEVPRKLKLAQEKGYDYYIHNNGKSFGGNGLGWVCNSKKDLQAVLREYYTRGHHYQLCYGWDKDEEWCIYHVDYDRRIGHQVAKTAKGISKIEALGDFVCTKNQFDRFAIYSIDKGENISQSQSYEALKDCVKAMKKLHKRDKRCHKL